MSEYEQGYRDGAADAANLKRIEHRIAAFGAIRRAAEVARAYEAVGWQTSDDGVLFVNDMSAVVAEAGIRRAIRAAIRSPKA